LELSSEGEIWEVTLSGGVFKERSGLRDHGELPSQLGISLTGQVEGMRGVIEGAAEVMGRPPAAVAAELTEIVMEVTSSGQEAADAVWFAPTWLVDLAPRLVAGESVVVVCPDSLHRETVRMLSARSMQAFVVAPGRAASGLAVSTVR
jgi:hypothetical protein